MSEPQPRAERQADGTGEVRSRPRNQAPRSAGTAAPGAPAKPSASPVARGDGWRGSRYVRPAPAVARAPAADGEAFVEDDLADMYGRALMPSRRAPTERSGPRASAWPRIALVAAGRVDGRPRVSVAEVQDDAALRRARRPRGAPSAPRIEARVSPAEAARHPPGAPTAGPFDDDLADMGR